MIGIKMKPSIPVHYQKGGTHYRRVTPTANIQPPPAAPPPPPPPQLLFLIFLFYFICTKIVLQEKIIPL